MLNVYCRPIVPVKQVEDEEADKEADEMEGDESRQVLREVRQLNHRGTQACVSVDLTDFNWFGEKTSTFKVIKPAITNATHPLGHLRYEEAAAACDASGGVLAQLSNLEGQNRLFDEMQRKYVGGFYWISAKKEGSQVIWLNTNTKSVIGQDLNLERVDSKYRGPNKYGYGVIDQYSIIFMNPLSPMGGYVCEFPGSVCGVETTMATAATAIRRS